MMLELALVTGRPLDELRSLADEELATIADLVREVAERHA
jgi:hypothetical protein